MKCFFRTLGDRPLLIHYLAVILLVAPAHSISGAKQAEFHGTYIDLFERAGFQDCKTGEIWAIRFDRTSDLLGELLRNSQDSYDGYYHMPSEAVYLHVRGKKSESGEWGHMGMYDYQITITNILGFGVDVPNWCVWEQWVPPSEAIIPRRPSSDK
jgi:hypothetical protein